MRRSSRPVIPIDNAEAAAAPSSCSVTTPALVVAGPASPRRAGRHGESLGPSSQEDWKRSDQTEIILPVVT